MSSRDLPFMISSITAQQVYFIYLFSFPFFLNLISFNNFGRSPFTNMWNYAQDVDWDKQYWLDIMRATDGDHIELHL